VENLLRFSFHNSKLIELAKHLGLARKQVIGLDLPAGYTCPAANLCKSYAHRLTGKIIDGKEMQYRCYAASGESTFPASRRCHWHNYDLLRPLQNPDMIALLEKSLPKETKVVRIHSSGDYFSRNYFYAWCNIAAIHPEIMFFGYTKILQYVRFVRGMDLPNFKIQYSYGGIWDSQLTDEPVTYVVKSQADIDALNVPVACLASPADDYTYITTGQSFAIPLHGLQPKGKGSRLRHTYAH
jgi:hypothetical protein